MAPVAGTFTCNVCLLCVVPFFVFFLTSYYSSLQRSKVKLTSRKKCIKENLRNDISLRFCNFCSEKVKKRHTIFVVVVGLGHSLLMDLGHNQQQPSTLHSRGS